MNSLKLIFNFYINSSTHVALAVFSLVRITELYYKLPYNENLDFFIFFTTVATYNFIKYWGVAKFYDVALTKSIRLISASTLICFFLSVYYGLKLPLKTHFYFLPFVIVTIFYSTPFWGGFQKSLRKINYLKIFLVAIVWSGVTGVIPLLANEYPINSDLVMFFLQRIFFVLVLILPFEIRDMRQDLKHFKTFPQKIGIERTKKMGFVLLLFSLTLEFLLTQSLINKSIFLWVCLTALFFLMRSTQKQSKYYSSFWVESIPILWWILMLILV